MSRTLREETEDVLACSRAFYRALEALDAEAMQSIWCHEEWVSCLHPGRESVEGWQEVLESWASIFRTTRQMRVKVSRARVRVEGDTAWVCCLEDVTCAYEEGFETALLEVTHIFLRRENQWRMAHRHASVLPSSAPADQTPRVQ
jgi:ketosteroid isomerase-like protein